MLTGSDLLAKLKDLDDVSCPELGIHRGWLSAWKDGGKRLSFGAAGVRGWGKLGRKQIKLIPAGGSDET
jgi:hypothetical protein